MYAQAALYFTVGRAVLEPASSALFPKIYAYETVREYPHDPTAFTQGLEYQKLCIKRATGAPNCSDAFWESTGPHLLYLSLGRAGVQSNTQIT